MKFYFSTLLVIFLIACSDGRERYFSEAVTHEIFEKKYDSLRTSIKKHLLSGIDNVNDFGKVYTSSEKIQLDSIIHDFKERTDIQIALITFDSLMTSKDSVEEATQIIGTKHRINTTIGISIPFRTLYIWNDSLINNTFLRQHEAQYIIDKTFFPNFRNTEYFKATFEGLKEIISTIKSNRFGKSLKH